MSLVNDMLQNLDERGELQDEEQLLPGCYEELKNSNTNRVLLLASVTLVLLVIVVWFGIRQYQKISIILPKVVPPSITAERTAQSSLLIEQKQLVPTVDQAFTLPGSPKSTDKAQDVETIPTITRLLEQAKWALAADKLTQPFGDNAYARYQSILYLQPNHTEALLGIQQIVERYVELARFSEEENDLQKSQQYWVRARDIAGQYPHVENWLDGYEAQDVGSALPKASAGQSSVVRTPSESYLDRKQAERAYQLIDEGDLTEAERILRQYLSINKRAEKSSEALFDVLIKQRHLDAAEALVASMEFLPKHRQHYLLSFVAIKRGDLVRARALLENYQPGIDQVPEYYGRLAGLYNKLGDYESARDCYQRLLQVDGEQPQYWLGLAVALDSLNQSRAALKAFRYARLYSPPDAKTRFYINDRITDLSKSG